MLRVLGEVEVDGFGAPRSQAQRTMLAALVLDTGVAVSRERLAELIWGDDQPENPEASLQNHVSRVRKVLPSEISVSATGAGYRLEAGADMVDAVAFDAGFRWACSQEPVHRLGVIDETLGLWRGAPFADLDDDRAAAEAARLEEMQLALREMRAESLLALGRTHEAVGDLERQRQGAPLRERIVELLMRAYVEAGRKTEALDAYRALREALVDELGLDPSPQLRELEAAILTEDLVAADKEQPVVAAPPAGHTIELPVSTFLGRSDDLERVGTALENHRIVTLVGTGGVGKTRLAIHSAHRVLAHFGDNAALIELASVRDPEQLGDAVATGLDLPPRAGASPVDRVVDAVANRQLLMVLDNCEHLIDAAAEFVHRAIRGTPRLHVLATSREPLNIDGERVLRIRPLPTDSTAIELFADRATAQADLVLDDASLPRVQQLCEALDGLPLAIELAAAQSASMTLEEIIEGLSERFDLLSGGRRTAHARHRSLRALVEWSVRGLDPELANIFACISVFSGSFTTEAAASVAALPERVVRVALAELVDRSLVVEQPVMGRSMRYHFLETIRAYAVELFADLGQAAEVTERHGEWVLGLVERTPSAMITANDVQAMNDLGASLSDLRIAHSRFLENGDADRSLRMASSLGFVAMFRMHAEMFRWIMQAADRFGDVKHPATEDVLAAASIGSWQSGDTDGARRYANQAASVAAASPYIGAGRAANEAHGDVAQFAGDNPGCLAHFEEAVRLSREQESELRVTANLADSAMVAGYLGDTRRAETAIAEASGLVAANGSVSLGAWVAYAEGEAFAEADPPRAVAALARALELADEASAHFITGVAGLTHTGLLARGDDPATAIPELVGLMEHWRTAGAWVQQWITLRTVVDLMVRLGQFREAAIVLGAIRASGDDAEATGADAQRLVAATKAIESERADAQELFDQGVAMGQRGVVELSIRCLLALGSQRTTPATPEV